MTTPVSRVPALALALSLVAISACDKEKPAEGEAKSEEKSGEKKADEVKADAPAGDTKPADATKTDEAKTADAGTVTPPTASTGDGVAYVSISGRGIARLDAAGWAMAIDDKYGFYSRVFSGGDGNVYVVDSDAIKKIDGNKLVEVAKLDYNVFSGAGSAVRTADGKFYASSYNKFGTFADGKWTVTEPAAIAAGLDSLSGVALAADGTVWVGGSKSLHYNKAGAGTWAAADLSSEGEHFFFLHLSSTLTGDVYVTNGSHLYKLSPEKLDKIEFKSEGWTSYSTDLAFNDKGTVLAAASSCELARVDPANTAEQWTVGKKGYNCLTAMAVALDNQNRAWVASREGLSVVNDDKSATEYPSSTVPELLGNYINDIVVVGNGPALPTPGPLRTGGLTGKVLLEGSPVASAKIEMCASPSYGGSQPCYDSKVKFVGTTNDKGEFSFDAVPIGSYNISVEMEGQWRMNFLPPIATEMKEGAVYDVGAVKFNKI